MDITAYKNKNNVSLIEMDIISAPIAWLNESVAPDLSEQQMLDWCENFYKNQKLTEEEMTSLIKRASQHKKMVPQDFLFTLTIACEILYKVIKNKIDNQMETAQ
jgi:hypothetical protein